MNKLPPFCLYTMKEMQITKTADRRIVTIQTTVHTPAYKAFNLKTCKKKKLL
jgi:hypothetical protein